SARTSKECRREHRSRARSSSRTATGAWRRRSRTRASRAARSHTPNLVGVAVRVLSSHKWLEKYKRGRAGRKRQTPSRRAEISGTYGASALSLRSRARDCKNLHTSVICLHTLGSYLGE